MTAADIEVTHDVEIINPDHVIAHLAPGGKLDMQIKVEQGRGYVPGNVRTPVGEGKAIGHIVLDASFGPVRRVSYRLKAHVSSSGPISIVWCSISRPTGRPIQKRRFAMRLVC